MILTHSVLEAIRAHAARAYPFEACGFILGLLAEKGQDPGQVRGLGVLEAVNSRDPESSRRRFNVEPEEFLEAELEADRRGLGIVAIYHSHPDHPAAPSDNDLQKALPYYRYLIVSVEKGQPKEATLWLLLADRSAFAAEDIITGQD
ncbi:MAG: M67 family metallopeptidase [Deltaproteobacteria bacterium]|jgi:proteasome lid subunit RPN8/RPN11|nr:M67 family metallopeptidase [Deltaproteobacteria bacterium]